MKEPYGEGPASHPGPESCVGDRKVAGEALTGVRAGQVSSCEITLFGAPMMYAYSEGKTRGGGKGEPPKGPAQSKTLCMHGNSPHGNRESPPTSVERKQADRPDKAFGRAAGAYVSGQSDGFVVPEKRPNNGGETQPAEAAEGRDPAKGNVRQSDAHRTQGRVDAREGLQRVREAARRDKGTRFTALLHHVTPERLRESYFALQRKAAPGVDGVTWREYGKDLDGRLRDLNDRVHSEKYRAQPSKRTYIPKADGRMRPLGIASLEDKIVQHAVVTVLNAVYEEDFLGFSYGFRPGRGAHDALDALVAGITGKKVNWVLDADIKGFFDNMNHEWTSKFAEHRIADPRVLRLIQKWLTAGVSEEGQWSETRVGTPQGAVISPLLANIYLHYAFDLWANRWRSTEAKGDVVIVRYADDFIVGFERREDAERFKEELGRRLGEFGLALHPEKTRLIEFGRFAAERRRARGEGRPETFDFLGFTHSCGQTHRGGKFYVRRRTMAKRMRAKLHQVRDWLSRHIHEARRVLGEHLRAVVQGYFNYHGIPDNHAALRAFVREISRALLAAIRRQSQKNRSTWDRIRPFLRKWLPKARIVHPYPLARFRAKHPRQEPYAVVPQVRICAGGAE